MAWPMPREPPVTNATRPLRSRWYGMSGSFLCPAAPGPRPLSRSCGRTRCRSPGDDLVSFRRVALLLHQVFHRHLEPAGRADPVGWLVGLLGAGDDGFAIGLNNRDLFLGQRLHPLLSFQGRLDIWRQLLLFPAVAF